MARLIRSLFAVSIVAFGAAEPQQMTAPYGEPIRIADAKKAAGAGISEAERQHLHMAFAIVDPGGELVYLEKMDGTQTASVQIAVDKARSAVLYKRATKYFEDQVAAGGVGLRFMDMRGAVPIDGGFPLVLNGKIIGAIGVSGGTNTQDGQCGLFGASSLK